jgi:hypothetical protein
MTKCYSFDVQQSQTAAFKNTMQSAVLVRMRLLEYLVEMFIQGFGITRPSEAQQKRVTLLLGGVLLTGAVLFVAIGIGMIFYLHSGH